MTIVDEFNRLSAIQRKVLTYSIRTPEWYYSTWGGKLMTYMPGRAGQATIWALVKGRWLHVKKFGGVHTVTPGPKLQQYMVATDEA
jgi:hypothetical protein